MSGFSQDPIQFINLIADNLRDRYQSGFPVIKELIQNTDDSEARDLDFGLSTGIPGAVNPLLKGPGLFLINNGTFKPTDAKGIRSFGQNTKAADEASIGKFGLGMKSVFHFCEAFFFLAHDGSKSYTEVLNPWSGGVDEESLHLEWDDFPEEDGIAIRNHLINVSAKSSSNPEHLFVLWLPLRKKSQQILNDGSSSGVIVSEYPGDDASLLSFLDKDDLPVKIAALMPMLRHLKRVGFWKISSKKSGIEPEFEIQLNKEAERLSLIGDEQSIISSDNLQRNVKGKFKISANKIQRQLEFSGLEYYGWNHTLKTLHEHELWPSSYVRDKNGHQKEAKDKAKPHGTVFFSRTEGVGRLITNWSVFLPLDENKTMEKVRCEGDYDYRLTLHGYFFIDAGRQGIHGLSECDEISNDNHADEASLRKAWNCELSKTGVFPLVIKALATFCNEQRLADKVQTSISQALSITKLYKEFSDQITVDHNWVREITPEGISWQIKSSEENVLKLPLPLGNDVDRPWRLFPKLKEIGLNTVFSIHGSANLLHSGSDNGWTEGELLSLLESVSVKDLFTDATLLDYLSRFIDEVAGPYLKTLSVQFKLVELIKQGLIKIGESALGGNQKKIKDISSHIDEIHCFKIESDLPASLLVKLLDADSNVLLLPARFYPDDYSGSVLSQTDAYHFLEKIELTLTEVGGSNLKIQNAALKLSERFIRAVKADECLTLLNRCSDMRILGGYNCRLARRVPVSVKEIRQARDDGVLFGLSQGTTEVARLSLAPLLQDVLPKETVYVINADTSRLTLNTDKAASPCNGSGVLKALGLHLRPLGAIESRSSLVSRLGVPSNENETRGLRYLLHAVQEKFHDEGTLWVLGYEEDEVWKKIWSQLVGGELNPWNLLDKRIMGSLPQSVWAELNIKEIRRSTVVEDLQHIDLSLLDVSVFEKEECEEILLSVQNDELWRSLPLHWTRKGEKVCGDADNVYLFCDEMDHNEGLFRDVHLIQCSGNAELLQRQKTLLKLLDDKAILEIALTRTDITDVWMMIMDALQSLASSSQYLTSDQTQQIKNSAWIPGGGDVLYKPEDVIDIEAINGELERMLVHVPNSFATPLRINESFLQHPFYSKTREKYFARGRVGFERLVLVLAGLDGYQIGGITFEDEKALRENAKFFSSYDYPGWRLLSTIVESADEDVDVLAVAESLSGPVKLDIVLHLLNWISKRGSNSKKTVRIFNRYLTVFANMEGAKDAISQLSLFSQARGWVASETLVSGVSGIMRNHVLDDEQAKILEKITFCDSSSEHHEEASSACSSQFKYDLCAKDLREYFELWVNHVTPPVIGAFVLLFGGEKLIKVLCKEYLGSHSREWLIDKIDWIKIDGFAQSWLSGCSFEGALEKMRMVFEVYQEDDIEVLSILKKAIRVPVSEEFDNLIVGGVGFYDGGLKIKLRRIVVDEFSDKDLSGFLQQSMIHILHVVYNQKHIDLESLWNDLDKSDQVDIELAKTLILQNIPFYLKQLGAHKNPKLSEKLNIYRDEERKEQEYKGSEKEEEFRERKEKSLIELQNTIKTDAAAKTAILDLVRQKVRDYQYQKMSVPFELFQNADDALHDLECIHAYPMKPDDLKDSSLPPSICRFVINVFSDRLVFMHWGRTINQFGSRGFPGRERGFDRDLENMLILSASDKGEGVTGKFGLGFKSIWLISDKPTIVSGRLQAEIIGGLLPEPVQNTTVIELRKQLSSYQPNSNWPGTAIELPLVDDTEKDVVRQFSNLAGYMTAFSRNIRSIDIVHEDDGTSSFIWDGRQLAECENIFIGHIRQEGSDLLMMKFDLNDGALLLAVGVKGFTPMPKGIPNIWVTAPIREQEWLGFAINAMFEVDAGRSRLSASVKDNQQLAHLLGKQLGTELEGLREAVELQWNTISEKLQFSLDLKPYHFWESLWQVFMSSLPMLPRESGTRVIATEVLRESLGDMAVRYDIIPNGLPSQLQRLIRLSDIKVVLKGALSDDDILLSVASTECFQAMFDVELAITSEMSTWLETLRVEGDQSKKQWQSIGLLNLFMQFDKSVAITSEDANILGAVLNLDAISNWGGADTQISTKRFNDIKDAVKNARDIKFLSADGVSKITKLLLTEKGSQDEALRWAFAPACNRIAKDYRGKSVDFFLLCRDKLEAPADKLKEWILLANDSDRRCAALRYLIEGELSRQVAVELHKAGLNGQWLGEVDETSSYLGGWDATDKSRLIYQILKTPEEAKGAFNSEDEDEEETIEIIESVAALEKIYNWWKLNRDEYLEKYQRKTFPDGLAVDLTDDDIGKIDRSSWLTLFLLGGFHTMGRTLPEQHRKFIENCRNRGWWDVFIAQSPEENFGDWMGVLDEYVDQQVDQQEHEQWMMRFPIIYKLSRYLDEYIELIQGLDRYSSRFDLNALLATRTDPGQQGGGISVPPLGRTLGMGANFIVREALRSGVISNEYCNEHAFVPYKGVIQILKEMGCDGLDWSDNRFTASQRIHDYIKENMDADKFTFCGDFDIPLRIISQDWSLQVDLLGRSLSFDEGWSQ